MTFRTSKADLALLCAPLVCFGFAWLNSHLEFARRLEWRSLDWRTQVRAEIGDVVAEWAQPPPDERLLVIGVGERSTINISPWPFPRAYHGQLETLAHHDPPAVWAWDVIFQDRVKADGSPLDGEGDEAFAVGTEMLAEAGVPVVFAAATTQHEEASAMAETGLTRPLTRVVGDVHQLTGDVSGALPYPGLREVGYFGFADAQRDAGGIVRRMPMVLRAGDQAYPSLSLQTLIQYWRLEPDEVRVVIGEAIELGPRAEGRRIPIDEEGRLLINYRYEKIEVGEGLGKSVPVVEYFDQLVGLDQYFERQQRDIRPPAPMGGRIVLVGEFATDTGATPFSDQSPLVLLHANVINSVLRNDYVWRVSDKWIWWGALGVGYLGLGWLRRRSVILVALFTALAVLGYVGAAFGLWIEGNLWLPLIAPVVGFLMLQFGFIIYRVLIEQQAKRQMRQMFGTYLSPVVVDQMVESGHQPELGGMEAEVTAYFSDIQNFSSFSEVLTPPQLVALLNEYLSACTDIIQEQGGTLDKYIGDAVVAMFGAPVPLPEHAYRACLTSLLVQQRLVELRAGWAAAGDRWPALVKQMRMRIGLNTGPCLIGNMGSHTRFDYTMMGDNVNLAARMESGAKSWGVYTMVTAATREACRVIGGDRIVFRALGRVRVKGRSQPVPIYEIVGLAEDVDEATRETIADFEQGLERFYQRDWAGARKIFERCRAREWLQPDRDPGVSTNPSLVYLRILEEYEVNPPPEAWDGVYTMVSK